MVHYAIHTNTVNSFHKVKKLLVRKYSINLIDNKHIYVFSPVTDSDPLKLLNWHALLDSGEKCNCSAEGLVYLNMTIFELLCRTYL